MRQSDKLVKFNFLEQLDKIKEMSQVDSAVLGAGVGVGKKMLKEVKILKCLRKSQKIKLKAKKSE